MKLCLVGDSHIACLLSAWREMDAETRNGIDITAFAISGYDLGDLKEHGGILGFDNEDFRAQFRRSSNGIIEINLNIYDAFVIVGVQYAFASFVELFSRFSSVTLREPREDVTLLSTACLNICVDAILEKSIALRTLALIRRASEKPVIIVPEPCNIEAASQKSQSQFLALNGGSEFAAPYEYFLSRSRVISEKKRYIAVHQDPRTMIAGGGYTLNEYGRGGIKYRRDEAAARAARDDFIHMNLDYGRVALTDLLRAVRTL